MGKQTQVGCSKILLKTTLYVTETLRMEVTDNLENNNNLEQGTQPPASWSVEATLINACGLPPVLLPDPHLWKIVFHKTVSGAKKV